MIPELGHFSLILAFCLAVALGVIPLIGVFQGYDLWKQAAKSIALGYFCFLLLSLICLNQWSQTPLILISSLILSGITLVASRVGHPKGFPTSKNVLSVGVAARIPLYKWKNQDQSNLTPLILSVLGIINTGLLLFILTTNSFLHSSLISSNQSTVGRHFPPFNLVSTTNEKLVITQNDLLGKVSLVNVWASWCVSCRVENPLLLKLAIDNKIFMVGINYKDDKNAAQKWLSELGNPYFFSIDDGDGKLGVDLGVSGAPETYIVDKHGIIRYKYVGVLSEDAWQAKLKPEFDKWQQTK